jgi:hypothetical protein
VGTRVVSHRRVWIRLKGFNEFKKIEVHGSCDVFEKEILNSCEMLENENDFYDLIMTMMKHGFV